MNNLWGDAFEIKSTKNNIKKVLEKAQSPKEVSVQSSSRILNSKKISELDKLTYVRQEVYRILGTYEQNTTVIKTYDDFVAYINSAIDNGTIAIDTETNNSLDPISCKIMGLCLYTPGQKNAYIPINHVNIDTRQRLSWQITEKQVNTQLSRLDKTKIIMHNGKFDYEVIKCTCNNILHIDWDTMIGAKVLNELERAGLKQQYIEKIDPSIEKYSIENLFEKLPYEIVEPELFALYAATDAYMTYKLYEYQLKEFNKPENKGLYNLFSTIEMPVVPVVAEMELAGVCIDKEYSERLSKKYHKLYNDVQAQIDEELKKYSTQIANWRLTPEANHKEIKNGKTQKSKNEQLENPIKWSSTTQLAILLYDILKQPVVDKKTPRGTGEEILNQIDLPICKLILQSRGLLKLINTYIDKLPECVSPVDGRLHAHFNQFGADCITRNSALLTSTGYVYIDELFTGEEIDGEFYPTEVDIINRNLQLEKTSHRVTYHNTSTIKLSLKNGYTIEGTPNHPIICSGLTKKDILKNKSVAQYKRLESTQHFKMLKDISEGDIVAIPFNYNIFSEDYVETDLNVIEMKTHKKNCTMPKYYTEEFAELLGMYHADGIYKGHGKVIIANKDKQVRERVKVLVKSLFNLDCIDFETGIYFGCTGISELGQILMKGARNKIMPKAIRHSPVSVICAYIKGLTLDSTYNDKSHRLTITVGNERNKNLIQSILLNLGITSSCRAMTYTAEHDHTGNQVLPIQMYRLSVRGEMYKKFIDIIGVIQDSKKSLSETFTKCYHLTYNNVYYAYVDKIEHLVNDVYDITVPTTHSFISNGLISHNTGRFSSSDPNLQNIPSHNNEIRMMFIAAPGNPEDVPVLNNKIELNDYSEILTDSGWKLVKNLNVGDIIVNDNEQAQIINLNCSNHKVYIEF